MRESPGTGRMAWDDEMHWHLVEEIPVEGLGGQEHANLPGDDAGLLDWRSNPRGW
jgi:hypothetical protein